MKLSIYLESSKSKPAYIEDLHFTKCSVCGSKHLQKFDHDTFCMDCDWNSILMDVDCGNFEKQIAVTNRKLKQQSNEAKILKIHQRHDRETSDENVVA